MFGCLSGEGSVVVHGEAFLWAEIRQRVNGGFAEHRQVRTVHVDSVDGVPRLAVWDVAESIHPVGLEHWRVVEHQCAEARADFLLGVTVSLAVGDRIP